VGVLHPPLLLASEKLGAADGQVTGGCVRLWSVARVGVCWGVLVVVRACVLCGCGGGVEWLEIGRC
jgi:hypothetical protein